MADHENRPPNPVPPELWTVRVDSLTKTTTKEELKAFFSKFGKVMSCKVVRTGHPQFNCGAVQYDNPKAARISLEANGEIINGNVIKVYQLKDQIDNNFKIPDRSRADRYKNARPGKSYAQSRQRSSEPLTNIPVIHNSADHKKRSPNKPINNRSKSKVNEPVDRSIHFSKGEDNQIPNHKNTSKDLYLANSWDQLLRTATDFEVNLTASSSIDQALLVQKVITGQMSQLYDHAHEAMDNGDEEQAFIEFYRFLFIIRAIAETNVYELNSQFYDNMIGKAKTNDVLELVGQLQDRLKARYSSVKVKVKQNTAKTVHKPNNRDQGISGSSKKDNNPHQSTHKNVPKVKTHKPKGRHQDEPNSFKPLPKSNHPRYTDTKERFNKQSTESTVPFTRVFIKNLSRGNDTEDKLRQLFGPLGDIVYAKVVTDESGHPKGIAYVEFANPESAVRACSLLNGMPQNGSGKRLFVNKAWPKGWGKEERDEKTYNNGVWRIFVKNLDKSIDNKTLLQTFSAFGRTLSTKVVRDEQGVSLGRGYVVFLNEDDANTAITEGNGMLMGEKNVIVEKFVPLEERLKKDPKTEEFRKLFVRNLLDIYDTDDKLRALFSPFGEITDVHVLRDKNGKSRGCGLLTFGLQTSADSAIEKLNGLLLRPNKSVPFTEVFVKHLDNSYDSVDKVKQLFRPFGTVTHVRLIRDANGQSRRLAFVTFEEPDMALKACQGLNQMQTPSGNRLNVKTPDPKTSNSEETEIQYECEICFESKTEDKVTDFGCVHHFCIDCVTNYLETLITDGNVSDIKCPETGCHRLADQTLVKKLVSKETYDRYEKLLLKEATKDMEDIFNCPDPKCGALIEAEIHRLRAYCPRCQIAYCTNCMKKYHGLSDCPPTQAQRQDRLSESFVRKNCKSCPKCQSPIEKNEGCNHMTCIKCRHEFCWICLSLWSGTHYQCTATPTPTLGSGIGYTQYHDLPPVHPLQRGIDEMYERIDPPIRRPTTLFRPEPIQRLTVPAPRPVPTHHDCTIL